MSIIRADSIKNRSGAGAPDFPNGITVTGVVTATSLNNVANNVDVDDFISVGNNIHLGNAGVVTATTFKGNIDAVDGDFDGTLEVDAMTVNGTSLPTYIAGVTVTRSTNATNITVADESSDTTCFPTFVTAATGDLPPKTGSNLSFNSSSGQLTATSFAGSGANLTSLAANQLSSGTIPDARFPATLPAASAANLTSIPAGNLTGTVADARISTLTASKLTGALPAISGSNLTGIVQSVIQIKEFTNRSFETQSFSANVQMGTQLEGHITPTSASNKIRITLCAFFSFPNRYNSSIQIKRSTNGGSSYGGLDATVQNLENVSRATGHIPSLWGRGGNWSDNVNSICTIIDSPNTTGQVYYRPFWVSNDPGTLYTNYNYDTSQTGNAYCKTVSILRLEEIDSSALTFTNVT
jgi:hypothetical protein